MFNDSSFFGNFHLIMLQYLGNQMLEFEERNAMTVVCLPTATFKTLVSANHLQVCAVY